MTPSARELLDIVNAVRTNSPGMAREMADLVEPASPTAARENPGADFLDPEWPDIRQRAVEEPARQERQATNQGAVTAGNTSAEQPHVVEINTRSLRPNREWATRHMPRIHPIQPDSLTFVELTLVVRMLHGFRRTVLTGPDMNRLRIINEQTERQRPATWVNSYVSILACPDAEPDAWTWDVVPIALTCLYCVNEWTIPSDALRLLCRESREIAAPFGTDSQQLISECPRCARRVSTHLRFEYLRNALFRRNREEGWVLPQNAVARTLTGL